MSQSSSCSPAMVVGVVVVALVIIVLMFAFRRPAMAYGAMGSLNQSKGTPVYSPQMQYRINLQKIPKANTLNCLEKFTTQAAAVNRCNRLGSDCQMVDKISNNEYRVCRLTTTCPTCPTPSCPNCPPCTTPQSQPPTKPICAVYADGMPLYCNGILPKGSTVCKVKDDGMPILCENSPANPQDLPLCAYYADGSPLYCNGTLPPGTTICGVAGNGGNILCQLPQ